MSGLRRHPVGLGPRAVGFVSLLFVGACGHTASQTRAKNPRAKRVRITGSHIRHPVDPRTGVPETAYRVGFVSRRALRQTGFGLRGPALGRAPAAPTLLEPLPYAEPMPPAETEVELEGRIALEEPPVSPHTPEPER